MKTVVISREGGRDGGLFAGTLGNIFRDNQDISVEEVESYPELLKRIDLGESVDAVVFVSNTQLEKAKLVAAKWGPKMRVVLFTADPPEKLPIDVVIIDKSRLPKIEQIRNAVLLSTGGVSF